MEIVILLFDRITALDAVGPYEVLSRLPGATVRFVAPTRGTVRTDNGFLGLVADASIDEVSRTDLVVIPGGFGTRLLLRDPRVLDWVREIDRSTQTTASVCTGSLVLGAAGLLQGRRATTHWAVLDHLSEYGAIPIAERIVRDGKYATAAGVSTGIDLGLTLAIEMAGSDVAAGIQLALEYDPAPPLQAGSPETAPPAIVEGVRARIRALEDSLRSKKQ